MKKSLLAAAAATLAMLASAPASAAIYTYTMINGSKLTIDKTNSSATLVGRDIDVQMRSRDFANFTGGARPTFTATLSSLDGYRLINGKKVYDNPLNSTTTHPQKLIMEGININLWAWWGHPIIAGDYLTKIKSYTAPPSSTGGTPVSEPGVLGLFGLGLAGLWASKRRRRSAAAPADTGKLAFA